MAQAVRAAILTRQVMRQINCSDYGGEMKRPGKAVGGTNEDHDCDTDIIISSMSIKVAG